VKHSHFHIADSVVIQQYIRQKYLVESEYIPYGPATETADPAKAVGKFSVEDHFLLMARMEPENNVEMILEGFSESSSDKKMIVVGNTNTAYGKKLLQKFTGDRTVFKGGIFEPAAVEALRKNTAVYFHGHSVGGTNPSLLEAMNAGLVIAAHDNAFNKTVLGKDALYFNSTNDVRKLIDEKLYMNKEGMVCNNLKKLEDEFNREKVIERYSDYLTECYKAKQ
jgi:glycosyltransferase involved in cell wall biosynthesis